MANRGGKRNQSGRKPGSQNKATSQIRALASEHAETAIQTLVDLMQTDKTPAAARISAAKELLERGFGKSGNYTNLDLETPISELSPKDAIAIVSDRAVSGDISLEEGQRLVAIIESRIKAIELNEIEVRLAALELK